MMKAALAACFVLALGAVAAAAADSTPAPAASAPAASTPAASAPAAPTPAALGYAATIIDEIGLKSSLDRLVPAMTTELQREVLATRPELRDAVNDALKVITPEFNQGEKLVLDDLAKFLATQMTEQELKDAAAFYGSLVGKKFANAQGLLSTYGSKLVGGWRDQMSTDLPDRLHAELKKTNHDF
jgi:hypothetical protein